MATAPWGSVEHVARHLRLERRPRRLERGQGPTRSHGRPAVPLQAAETTLQARGVSSNEEGNLARAAIETRRDRADERLKAILLLARKAQSMNPPKTALRTSDELETSIGEEPAGILVKLRNWPEVV